MARWEGPGRARHAGRRARRAPRLRLSREPSPGDGPSADEIGAFLAEWQTKRHDLPFETDGVVLKVNAVGRPETARRRRRSARAGRSPTSSRPRRRRRGVTAIVVQVGRTGVLTPVAEFEPVLLAGTTVRRATLHNYEDLSRKDVRVGDTVAVEKGGDVIPKVTRVLLEKRPNGAVPFDLPSRCPSCGEKVVRRRRPSRSGASTRPARRRCRRRSGTTSRAARWTWRGWATSGSTSCSRRGSSPTSPRSTPSRPGISRRSSAGARSRPPTWSRRSRSRRRPASPASSSGSASGRWGRRPAGAPRAPLRVARRARRGRRGAAHGGLGDRPRDGARHPRVVRKGGRIAP